MFSVNTTTGSINVFSQLNWNYAAVVVFQVLAANTKNFKTLQYNTGEIFSMCFIALYCSLLSIFFGVNHSYHLIDFVLIFHYSVAESAV